MTTGFSFVFSNLLTLLSCMLGVSQGQEGSHQFSGLCFILHNLNTKRMLFPSHSNKRSDHN